MRIAIGAVLQETNTFSPVPSTLDHFRGVYYAEGEEVRSKLLDSSTEISGFYDVLEEGGGCQVVPTVAAMAVSGGRVDLATYAALRDALLGRLEAARPDAVLLALHGAMCTEEADDGDGLLLADVRSVVGAECPIFVTHDLHANLTRHRAALCDAVVGYRTAPHVDHRSTGRARRAFSSVPCRPESGRGTAWRRFL